MHRHPLAQLLALVLTLATAASACTPATDQATALAMVGAEPTVTPTVTPTAVATTQPLAVPTATALPIPPTATPEPTAIPPTATAEPTAVPTATAAPATATVVPAPTVVPVVPATAVPEPTAIPPTVEPTAVVEATAVPEPTATPEPTAVAPTATPEPTPEPTGAGGPPASHVVTNAGYVTLGQAGSTSVRIPSALVELIGFHEASHPGAKGIVEAASGLNTMVLGSRGRGTPARSAADIVVPPGEPLRAPVTGTVVAARQYVLYCEHTDSLVYIEPDGLPGWQVRLFHVQGDLPAVGSRVIAGETIVASGGANPLPFESQVDAFTAEPSWAHTHLEVVDTNVPDDRPPGGGC